MLTGLLGLITTLFTIPRLISIFNLVVETVKTAEAFAKDVPCIDKKTYVVKELEALYNTSDAFLNLDDKMDTFVKKSLPHLIEIAVIGCNTFGWVHE